MTPLKLLSRVLVGTCLLCIASIAYANKNDTLTGLTPGDVIGCDYTFQNGDPSIPCAQDTVAADGTVSFLKPFAPYDNIEYRNITTGKPITALINPLDDPIDDTLTPGMRFPLLTNSVGSFFDVFVEIDLPAFIGDGLSTPGAFTPGQQLDFDNGANTNGFDGISIPGFTGAAFVVGFDIVGVPEPGTLALMVAGLVIFARTRMQAHRS
jgi:hypothetical protein